MATAPVRVLLVEDNAADAQLTADMLAFSRAPGYALTRVARLAEARALLETERFGVVLLDLGLPDTSGLEGVCDVRAAAPEAAIIVLSGLGSEAIAVEALTSGAQDYLVKGRADQDALQRSIRFAMARNEADVAQRRLAAIVESSDDAIVTMDLDARIISWNAGAERLFGYASDDAVGQPVAMLVPPDRAGEERALLARVLAGERVHNHVTSQVLRDGGSVDVSVTLSAVAAAQGSVIAVSAIVRDITASTRAAASLHAAQERFRIAFEEAPIGMALIGLDRCFIEVNAAFGEITGYADGELEGSPTSILVPSDDPEHRGAAVTALLAGTTSRYSADRRLVHRAGHPIWVAMNVTCVRDHEGAPQHFLGQMQDITDRRRYEARLQHMADHDPLTGLLNRRAFERELRNHVQRGERYGRTGAALMIDLDHFKYYNDTLGHLAGDGLITRVAAALAARLRKSDVLGRLGGDEFAVILPNAGEQAARRVAGELLECVRGEGLIAPDGVRNVLTASIGVAFFDEEAGLQPEDVMVNADLAMYDAKEAGRDRASFYPATGHARARMRSRVTWVESIRAALDNGRFELLAQPIVDLRGERARRYELLLRMRASDGDLIPPAAFLRIAEHLDLVQEIDRWVVTRATELLVEHAAAEPRGQPLGQVDRRSGAAGAHRAPHARDRHRPGAADLRDHRDRGGREHRDGARVLPAAARARLPLRARRLRRGLRIVLLPQAPAVRLPEDRRRVRPQLRERPDRPAPGDRGRRHRARARQGDDRRVRRRRRGRRRVARARRGLGAGLPPRGAGAAGGAAGEGGGGRSIDSGRMPVEPRFVPRFVAEPPQEPLPYGRWADTLSRHFLGACDAIDPGDDDLGGPGEVTFYPDRTWHGRTFVPATAMTSTGLELFGYVSFRPGGEDREPTEFSAVADYTEDTAEANPEWKLDLCDEVVGVWRGEAHNSADMTLVWGRPLTRGGAIVTAELADLAVDQCVLVEDRFTLLAPDGYRGDTLDCKLFDKSGREIARESLYGEDDGEDEAPADDEVTGPF